MITNHNESVGQLWLQKYAKGLVTHDAKLMASLFHPGLTYIVNDSQREGSDTFCKEETWSFIFSRIEFRAVDAYNVFEPRKGHIFYHEAVTVYLKQKDVILEGHFGDESVVNRNGQMLLINRVASAKYFEEFTNALS
jgi:hypothetical protein